MCAICPQNTVSDITSTSCNTLPGYYVDPDGEIVQAPDGVNKDVGDMRLKGLSLAPGFWRTNSNSTEILPCLNEDHCVGGSDPSSYCAEGYTGPLCAVCSSGYAAIGASENLSCNQCSGSSTATVAVGVLLIVFLLSAALVYRFKEKCLGRGRLQSFDSAFSVAFKKFEKVSFRRILGIVVGLNTLTSLTFKLTTCPLHPQKVQPAIKIVFSYFQVVGGLGSLFGIKFPPLYSRVTSFIGGVVSLDFISFLPLGCMAPTDFYSSLLAYTALPLVFSACLIGYYVSLSKKTDEKSVSTRNKIFETFLAITFVLLPSVSIKVLSTFACHDFDDGSRYLKVDYSIDCNASTHSLYWLYSGLMVLLYPIGVPFMYWYLLWKRRDLLSCNHRMKEMEMSEDRALESALKEREANEEKHKTLKALSFLYGSYEPKYWWFEVFETLRKLGLTGFLVFLAPGTAAQVLFSLVMCINAMRVYSVKVRCGKGVLIVLRLTTMLFMTMRLMTMRLMTMRLRTMRLRTMRLRTMRLRTMRLRTMLFMTMRLRTMRLRTMCLTTMPRPLTPPPPPSPTPSLTPSPLPYPQKPFIDDFNDKFSEVALWQLFYTLLAALAMKVNLDNENLQDRRYFDILLTLLQFVPALVLTIKNVLEAVEHSDNDIGGEGKEEEGLELGYVESPVTNTSSRRSFTNVVSTREGGSLSKQEVELGGEAVSKHEKRKG